MDALLKIRKPKLKEMYIQKLNEIETLLKWLKERGVTRADGLVINSNYLVNRSLKNPNDFIHKSMKIENYALEIKEFQSLIDALEKLKQEYEIGNRNQNGNEILEKSNLIQKDDEKSNLIQKSSRGGRRVGAGRKGLGKTKKVSLTLSEDTWKMIEERIKETKKSQSEILRELIEKK